MSEAWVTDDDLRSARERFAAQIPGLVIPVAYSVARQDAEQCLKPVDGLGKAYLPKESE